MPEDSPEIVAKKRLVVNEESHYSAPRKQEGNSLLFEDVVTNSSYFSATDVYATIKLLNNSNNVS